MSIDRYSTYVTEKYTASFLPVADKDFAHVVNSLQKDKNKPTRKARLLGMVKSLLDGGKAEAAVVERVVSRLVNEGHVLIDEKGAVTTGR